MTDHDKFHISKHHQFNGQPGFTKSRCYRPYLDYLQEATGSIIFSALDSESYIGNLAQLHLIPGRVQNGTVEYAFPALPMSSFSMTARTGVTSTFTDHFLQTYPIVLDSSSTVSLLDPLLEQVMLKGIIGI
jgi:hypothetical protein